MTTEDFEKIFETDSKMWKGDNAYQGLQIIAEYLSNLICGADHDIIYSCGVEELVEAGITKEHAEKLNNLNWMIYEGEYLACYV